MSHSLILFEDFLSSLSKLVGFHFQLRDGDKVLFHSNGDQALPALSEEMKELATRIVDGECFEYSSLQGKYDLFGVPLRGDGDVTGCLIAYGATTGNEPGMTHNPKKLPVEEMKSFLSRLSGLVQHSSAFQSEMDNVSEELSQSFEDIYMYSRIATQIKTLKFSRSMLLGFIEEILSAMRVDFAFAKLPDRKGFDVQTFDESMTEKISDLFRFSENVIGAVPQDAIGLEDNYFIVNDSRIEAGFGALHPDPYRFLMVEIRHNEDFYGWLGLLSFNMKEIFRRSELRLMKSLAEQIGVVIANTDLYADLERLVINVVKSLVQAIEAKDIYTSGHSERVSEYCMLMAERLELEPELKKVLYWASVLHDVGKIGISENILNKPGRLNDEEYSDIKAHPQKAHAILQPLDHLAASLPAILHHHERYDGKGYPDGLSERNIPLLARVIAVADTFDAITSTRAYRPARSWQEAVEILDEVAGTQLDPEMVDVFKEVLRKDLKKDLESRESPRMAVQAR
jgi:HD superfamily phosphodiesterase